MFVIDPKRIWWVRVEWEGGDETAQFVANGLDEIIPTAREWARTVAADEPAASVSVYTPHYEYLAWVEPFHGPTSSG